MNKTRINLHNTAFGSKYQFIYSNVSTVFQISIKILGSNLFILRILPLKSSISIYQFICSDSVVLTHGRWLWLWCIIASHQLPKVVHVSHETISNSQNFQYAVNSHAIGFQAAVVWCKEKLGSLRNGHLFGPHVLYASLQRIIQCYGWGKSWTLRLGN